MRSTSRWDSNAVRDYYNANTRRFLQWGKDRGTFNIHGALWPPGVVRLDKALEYANELVRKTAAGMTPPATSLLDLGCGVGSGLFYLSRYLKSFQKGYGISISPVQIEIALRRAKSAKDTRLHFAVIDFLEAGQFFKQIDLAYSIEAFAHASDPGRFFQQAASALRPGGKLVLIDDTQVGMNLNPKEERLLQTYRHHWLLPSLLPENSVLGLAEANGLVLESHLDLTPWLRLRRPRDRFVSVAAFLFRSLLARSWYGKSLLGGDAKQKCYLKGITQYRLWVFAKTSDA
ncbi:MAG: methyltransferase domain-containing protein [Haliscomenobacter sp.]|nr:methyltransferase domain-containing protein [Haliscomenobacter sp.]